MTKKNGPLYFTCLVDETISGVLSQLFTEDGLSTHKA